MVRICSQRGKRAVYPGNGNSWSSRLSLRPQRAQPSSGIVATRRVGHGNSARNEELGPGHWLVDRTGQQQTGLAPHFAPATDIDVGLHRMTMEAAAVVPDRSCLQPRFAFRQNLGPARGIRGGQGYRMKRDLAIRALKMAIALRAPPKGCIFHSDRGSQYCLHDDQKIQREHGFQVSMSGKGNFYDNAAVETFFRTIKAELIWRRAWETRRQAETAIFQYINGFYNPRRRHSALGRKSPRAFERKAAQTSTWSGTNT